MENDSAQACALLFDQAKAQLEQQNADLGDLRTRAVGLLAVSSLVAGLFGTHLPFKPLSNGTVAAVSIALLLFACDVTLTLLIAWPTKKWLFTFRLNEMFDLAGNAKLSPADVTFNIARWAEEARTWNRGKLDRLYLFFAWMCAITGLQVAAWVVAALN